MKRLLLYVFYGALGLVVLFVVGLSYITYRLTRNYDVFLTSAFSPIPEQSLAATVQFYEPDEYYGWRLTLKSADRAGLDAFIHSPERIRIVIRNWGRNLVDISSRRYQDDGTPTLVDSVGSHRIDRKIDAGAEKEIFVGESRDFFTHWRELYLQVPKAHDQVHLTYLIEFETQMPSFAQPLELVAHRPGVYL